MTDSMAFQVFVGSFIPSPSTVYEVEALLGSGTFGDVTQCRNLATNEKVALKILKSSTYYMEQAEEEVVVLKTLRELGSEKFNIVRWNDSFTVGGRFCMEFEKLDISLLRFLLRRRYQPLSLKEIRPMIQQLATAFDFLKRAGIVHADLKPDNIMLVDHERQPLKVKVIDFGLAMNTTATRRGMILQTLWYRAPEVLLGSWFNEAIDVWSLGCTAAEMLMTSPLFPGDNEYDMMRHIYYTVGKPPVDMLNCALFARQFYSVKVKSSGKVHRKFLPTLEQGSYNSHPRTLNSLSDLMTRNVSPNLSGEELRADKCDREMFVDLLTKTLNMVGAERITPSEILLHPFITMSHLVGTFDHSSYVKKSMELMSICEGVSSKPEEGGNPAELEQPQAQDHVVTGENDSSRKRKRDGEDGTECKERSPQTSPEKRARTELEESAQTSSQKSRLLKRKRDDADKCTASDENSSSKRTTLSQQLMNSNSPEKRARTELEKAAQTKTRDTSSQKSQLLKRKRDDDDGCMAPDENSPSKKTRVTLSQQLMNSTSPEKRARTELEEAAQTSSQKSQLLKRKRDDADGCTAPDENSPSKKTRVTLSQQLMKSINKLVSSKGTAQPSHTQTPKRKREEEEAGDSVGMKSSPAKLRRSLEHKTAVEPAEKSMN